MMPIVLLDVQGGPSPVYQRWMMFARRWDCTPIVSLGASLDLVKRLAPDIIVLVRTMYTYQPCRVEWCERSVSGCEMGAYVARVAVEMGLNADFRGLYPSALTDYPVSGLDVTLTGYLIADGDTLEAVAAGVGEYMKAKGN